LFFSQVVDFIKQLQKSYPKNLPVVAQRQQIVEAIRKYPVVVIAGDTGSGKTTQLPKMCLEAGQGKKMKIGCTQPRRIAAVSVAARVAEELGGLGYLAGYKIRFRDQTSAGTRIKFMTDGILLAEAQRDRNLSAYDTIIIDEAHERSLNIDFLLGIFSRLRQRRHDLKIIITSATIDTAKFAKAFANAPVIEVSGRTYPVEYRYLADGDEDDQDDSYVEKAVSAVNQICSEEDPGDILVFMPTERDIRESIDLITKGFASGAIGRHGERPVILPLFGRLSGGDQGRVFRRSGGEYRKIVVATNVAETSVTVPGIRYVVDTGLARISSYNVRARTTKLPVTSVSRASCDQRAGRCGRIGPGICFRLYSEENYNNRTEFTRPEILRSNLAEVILRMLSLQLGAPSAFPFVDSPSPRAIKDGFNLLQELGAIAGQGNKLTSRGRLMARLPLDPRISRMIIEARNNNCLREVVIIAAALSIQDPRIRPAEKAADADEAHGRFKSPISDFLTFLHLWDRYQALIAQTGSTSRFRKFCKSHYLSFQRMREWRDIHKQIWSVLAEQASGSGKGGKKQHPFHKSSCLAVTAVNARRQGAKEDDDLPGRDYEKTGYEAVHKSLLSGNLRNIGLRKDKNIYQGGHSKELMVFPGSGQFGRSSQWIMAAELVETSRLYARTVALIKPEWIEPVAGSLCRSSYSEPRWQKKQGQVVATEKVTLFGLIIVPGRLVGYGRIKPDEARHIFIQSALVEGELGGRLPRFLRKNRKLIRELTELEERMRRRDIMVDDHVIFQFYDHHLTPEVCSRATLNQFLKKNNSHDLLCLKQEDLVREVPVASELEDFPRHLMVKGVELSLSYNFKPGSDKDGVTVFIPLDQLSLFSGDEFQWLVPGLLAEKLASLLKGLPKTFRRQLIPVARTADELLPQLKPYEGSLYSQLAALLHRHYRMRLERSNWSEQKLADHLRMRFVLVDEKGRKVAVSRNFVDLLKAKRPEVGGGELDRLRGEHERQGISTWDFAELPDRVAVSDEKGRISGYAWPGLIAGPDHKVAIRLYPSREKSRQASIKGLTLLYRLQFARQWKGLKKDLAIPRAHWALYQGLASHEEFNADLLDFILAEIFAVDDGLIPDQAKFDDLVGQAKAKGLYLLGRDIRDRVISLLQERLAVLDFIRIQEEKGLTRLIADGFRQQVMDLVPIRFLQNLTGNELRHIPRYLKAIKIRLERRQHNPAKDLAREQEFLPFQENLAQALKHEVVTLQQKELLAEYQMMVQEFSVSLFAQELRTAIPVSAKRLRLKWRELQDALA